MLKSAREGCLALLASKDRSSLILSKYVPAQHLDGWLALRALSVDTAKIVDSVRESHVALTRLQHWKQAITRLTTTDNPRTDTRDPSSLQLLAHSLKNSRIHQRYLLTLLQTRESQLMQLPINTIQDLARIGEGTHSQVLYATLDMLQASEEGTSEFLSQYAELDELVSEIVAHIGQAAGIAGAIRALVFYAQKHNRILLPKDVLAQHDLGHQSVVDLLTSKDSANQSVRSKLKDVVFDVATSANDHILTARQQLKQFKESVGKTPPSLKITTLSAVPITLYLERLQKNDFEVTKKVTEWKLPWRSWRSFRTGTF